MQLAATLRDRAARGGVALPDQLVEPLLAYYQLLRRWNEKINLTALGDTDEALDRLLLEPVAAAQLIRKHLEMGPDLSLIDLGSGGGSPAIPLALALPVTRLIMVESRGRKAAFLREAARALPITAHVEVEARRFEELSRDPSFAGQMHLVSVRAVRADATTLAATAAFLRPGGHALLFRGPEGADRPEAAPDRLAHVKTERLLPTVDGRLTILRRV